MILKEKLTRLLSGAESSAVLLSGMAVYGENAPFIEAEAASACTVNTNKTYQTIRGFGGMNLPEWQGYDLTDSQIQTVFGNGSGQLGLTVLRIYVSDDKNAWSRAIPTAKGAQQLGATVMQTSDSAQEMKLQLQYKDASGETAYVNIAKAEVNSKEWTKLENTSYTVPEGATDLVFYIESTDGTFNFYVDDVQFASEGTASKVTTGGGTVGEISEPVPSDFNYNANLQYRSNDKYLQQTCPEQGKVVKESYSGINGNKSLLYLRLLAGQLLLPRRKQQ